MTRFGALLGTGIVLSVVGAVVDGLLWLTVLGILTLLAAAVYAVLSPSSPSPDSGPEP